MLFIISKQTFPKLQGQLMPMTGIISGAVMSKHKTKSNPFAKSQDLLKICGNLLVFANVIKRTEFSLPKGYQY